MTPVDAQDPQLLEVRKGADRVLSLLLLLHFPAALALSVLHGTYVAAIVAGGGISLGAYLLAKRAPGAFGTRVFIAVGLMAYSALFISQSQGMVELHFHIFGALAFLLVSRDWRVIVIGAGFVALHHLGFMLLQDAGSGVYVMPAEHLGLGMVLLHAVFVVFETSVLVILSRSLEQETLDASRLRAEEAVERAQLAALAAALQRRDLSVGGEVGDGSASATTQQVAASTQQTAATAGQLAASAQRLDAAADALSGLVTQFTTA